MVQNYLKLLLKNVTMATLLSIIIPISITQAEIIDNTVTEILTQEEAEAIVNTDVLNNQEYVFEGTKASWKVKPELSFPNYVLKKEKKSKDFNLTVRLKIDKQGNVSQSSISKSSGIIEIDRSILRSMRGAKFNAFIKNGVPVDGIVYIPIVVKSQ